ncbi:MAG: glycolate oxidase iron-sulfur subunit, partial [Variibacter sp.]|nr:glycolate oxidase iron-sulfur subunit [Variibacter sp.]
MQTNFSIAQLADPDLAEANQILRACVHCGFCTATCPTYVLLGDELDSPRGRIYLIKEMLEEEKPATKDVAKHIDRCLSCLACMTTCPSGVHYMHLIDQARVHVERTYRRPLHERILRALIANSVPYPARFRLSLQAARLAKPLRPLLEALGLRRLAAILQLAPAHLPPAPHGTERRAFLAEGPQRGRVIMLRGCTNDVLAPSINGAAIRLLTRHGVEVILAGGEACCGSLVHHMGREHRALQQARNIIDVWTAEMARNPIDAIIITASGCGTTVKDYGYMFRTDAAYADKAARVSQLTKDVSEFLTGVPLRVTNPRELVVAYHSACSLQHGQKVVREPKQLLSEAGYVVKDVPEGHICCGSAGTYNMLQPEL